MYNMQFSFLGMKFTLGIVLLIMFLYWLMWGHVLYSCSNGSSMKEALRSLAKEKPVMMNPEMMRAEFTEKGRLGGIDTLGGLTAMEQERIPWRIMPTNDYRFKQEIEFADDRVYDVCLNVAEGFTGANTNYGESSKFSLTMGNSVDTSSWFTPNLTYSKGTSGGKGVQNILNRQQQPVPLPEGELLMFANTPFKPECCPNAYSNSTGCACMTVDQYNYLINRGGNNVPYSEY